MKPIPNFFQQNINWQQTSSRAFPFHKCRWLEGVLVSYDFGLVVIIFDKTTRKRMKPKKKTSVTVKKGTKKTICKSELTLVEKTNVTTKEKTTYNTLQDPVQTKDGRLSLRPAKIMTSRTSCQEQLSKCSMSPFSSPNRSSFSPRYRKTLSPELKASKEKTKLKTKSRPQNEKHQDKRKGQHQKKQGKAKTKMTKEECSHNLSYQNQLLKKLGEKKITELSQESSNSMSKLNIVNLNIKIPKQKQEFNVERPKIDRTKELRKKIEEKYQKELPALKTFEIKFYCSIVLIQRLWRQRRIKKFISEFISPRSNPECNITGDLLRESNSPRLDLSLTTEAQTSELIRKYHNVSFEKKREPIETQMCSNELPAIERKLDLKDLELSSELTPERQIKIVKFVECLRDIAFLKPQQNKKKTRMNVFNLQESLSEKCLMQSFYEKIFKPSPSKSNNFDIFKSKKEQKNLQRSIQLIQSLNSPEKHEVILLEERFETELSSKDTIQIKDKVQTAQISVATDEFLECQASTEINSLKKLNLFAENVVLELLNEFCEEYHAFSTKTTLKKKKKNILPGIRSSQNSIRQYLTGLTTEMFSNHGPEMARRFSLINPLSFLKIHHEYDEEEEEEYIEEQDEDLNLPIVPQTLYYEYQQTYEAEHFAIPQSDRKYSNFLESLIKIHNLLLINCFSEMIEKARMDRIILPWDHKMDIFRNKEKTMSEKALNGIIIKITNKICSSAFMRVGQFHKSIEGDSVQEERLLKSIHMEYQSEGSDWSTQYEYLELRMDLTKHIEEIVLEEVIKDMMIFI